MKISECNINMPFLNIQNLNKTFVSPGGKITKALVDISIKLPRGAILSIIGHNGSGKTTLLNCIRGTATPDPESTILMENNAISPQKNKIISVFQDINAGVVSSMTAIENLAVALSSDRSFLFSFPCSKYKSTIYDFLDSVGMYERFQRFEHTIVADLSGGQRQQLAILMAMLRKPQLLLLDEFVANLDPAASSDILAWTRKSIKENKITTLLVTHDLALAETWGDYLLELQGGKILTFNKIEAPA